MEGIEVAERRIVYSTDAGLERDYPLIRGGRTFEVGETLVIGQLGDIKPRSAKGRIGECTSRRAVTIERAATGWIARVASTNQARHSQRVLEFDETVVRSTHDAISLQSEGLTPEKQPECGTYTRTTASISCPHDRPSRGLRSSRVNSRTTPTSSVWSPTRTR